MNKANPIHSAILEATTELLCENGLLATYVPAVLVMDNDGNVVSNHLEHVIIDSPRTAFPITLLIRGDCYYIAGYNHYKTQLADPLAVSKLVDLVIAIINNDLSRFGNNENISEAFNW